MLFNNVAGCDYPLNVVIDDVPMSHALLGMGGNHVPVPRYGPA
jgi:hypothetical protein